MSECAHSTAAYRVEDEDGEELNEAIQSHVSEEAEGGDQRTSTFSAQKKKEIKTPHFVPTSQRLSQLFLRCLLFQILILTPLWLVQTLTIVFSPDKCGDAADVFRRGCERRGD